MADYPGAFFGGFALAAGVLAFAVAFTVLLSRWITGDENAVGVVIRAGLLLGLATVAMSLLTTVWYWLLLPLAVLPLVEVHLGEGVAAPWLDRRRHTRLAEAAAAAAEQPHNAVGRLQFARALLETRQIEAGLAALDEAVVLALPDSRELITQMAEQARAELVRSCPSCRHPNPASGRACRRCLSLLTDDALLRALLWILRPELRLLPRRG